MIRARARNIHRIARMISYVARIIRSQRDNIVHCPPLQQGWCSLLDQPCTSLSKNRRDNDGTGRSILLQLAAISSP